MEMHRICIEMHRICIEMQMNLVEGLILLEVRNTNVG